MASASIPRSDPLGRDLADLLRRLADHRVPEFSVGPQEAIDAHRLILALVGTGEADVRLTDFADQLRPILARSPDQARAFDRIIREVAPPAETQEPSQTAVVAERQEAVEDPEGGRRLPDLIRKRAREAAAGLLTLLVVLAILYANWGDPQSDQTVNNAAAFAEPQPDYVEAGQAPAAAPTLASEADYLERVDYVASLYEGAPTLREIARTLAPTARVPMQPDEYLRRLRDLTGLPSDQPLRADADPIASAAQIRWAVAQIEQPGLDPIYDELLLSMTGNDPLPQRSRASSLAVLQGLLFRSENFPLERGAGVSQAVVRVRSLLASRPETKSLAGLPEDVLARGLALAGLDWNPPDAPWLPEPPPAATAPFWAAWLAALAALLLGAAAMLPLLDPRRAFLRRRPPRTRPHRAQLINSLPQVLLGPAETFRDIRKALQRREPRPTRQLDVRATVKATLAAGGVYVVPRLAASRSAPDYLVLIDRKGVSDLEADRAAALIAPLRTGAIGLDVYFFNSDPSRVYSESGGAAVRIEELMARFPHHRLLLMTSGEDMLDLFSGRPRGGFAKLVHWRRRGLLTPIPRGEWAREERLIAGAMEAPVARSTGGGMLALAQRLLTDGAGRGPQLFADGDEDAPTLPRGLMRSIRGLPDSPGEADEERIDALITELSWYPDGPGFEWLCAMAVYPAATFDLCLYLGLRLSEWPGAPEGRTLYSPARLAALTRLPWLRDGRIPDWLRRRLIARLDPDRAAEVRTAILALIENARSVSADGARNRAGFGEEGALGPTPERLFDDEVLVEFLREGSAEDLRIDRPKPRSLAEAVRRIDRLTAMAAALMLAYAAAAWYVTPTPADGAPTRALWLPLLLLIAAALVSAALVRPAATLLAVRRTAIRFAPGGLVVAILAAAALAERSLGGWLNTAVGLTVLVAIWLLSWPLAVRILARLRGTPWSLPEAARDRVLAVLKSGAALLAATLLVYLAWSVPTWSRYLLALIAAGLAMCGLGALWSAPRRPSPEPDLARLRGRSRLRASLPFAAAFALLLPALWLAADIRDARGTFPPGGAAERLVATSPDGLIALTDVGQRTILVVEANAPKRVVKRFTIQAMGGYGALPATVPPPAAAGPIVALAVTRHGEDSNASILVAAATADGTMVGFDANGRQIELLPAQRQTPWVTPPRIAFVEGGLVAYSMLRGDGRVAVAASRALDGRSRDSVVGPLEGRSRVTAMAAIGGGVLIVGRSDGRVEAVDTGSADGALAIVHFGVAKDRLPGGARLIRAIPRADDSRSAFVAVAEDGTALRGFIGWEGVMTAQRVAPIPELAVGPVVPWAQRRNVAPEPPPDYRGGQDDSTSNVTRGQGLPGQTPAPDLVQTPAPTLLNASTASLAALLERVGAPKAVSSGISAAVNRGYWEASLRSNERLAAFLAMLAAESGGFKLTSERFPSSAERLRQIWPRQFPTEASTRGYAGNPERIANRAYAGMYGNGPESSGDGWRYRGRGYLQITGRANYQTYGQETGVDLVANPDRMEETDVSVRAALALWRRIGGNAYADKGDLTSIVRRVSGGTNGLQSYRDYYGRILADMNRQTAVAY